MHVRHPIWLRKIATPSAEAFAVLFAIESMSRALLTAVIPIEAYNLLGHASLVSLAFFVASCFGLVSGLTAPWLIRRIARRRVYTLGALLLAGAGGLFMLGGATAQVGAMTFRVVGIVAATVCVNLYIMDNIPRGELSHAEPKRIFYSAGAWTVGPALGVYLRTEFGEWVPYLASSLCALAMLGYFWFLKMTERPIFSARSRRAPGVLENVRQFAAQPRMVFAWLIAIGRNGWWAMFFVYTPIYAVQSGLGEVAGGMVLSIGTGFLFLMPVWGWCVRRYGMRRMLIIGFTLSAWGTLMVAVFYAQPWLAMACLLVAAMAMVMLDATGSLPFMLAVRPGQRAEMTAVYSTYRDAAETVPPGLFSLLLRVFELPVVFIGGGIGMLALALLSRRSHPRLGIPRLFETRQGASEGIPAPSGAAPGRTRR